MAFNIGPSRVSLQLRKRAHILHLLIQGEKTDLHWQSGLSIVPVMEALVLHQVKQGVSCGSLELSAEQQAAGA